MFGLSVGRITAAVYTSPHATADLDPAPAVIAAFDAAQDVIHFAIYSITHTAIADALIAAHNRGVLVVGVADHAESSGATSQIPRLIAAGIDVKPWGSGWKLMHDKVWVTDPGSRSVTVGLGSFNWTNQAEKSNIEVLLTAKGSQVNKVLAPTIQAQITAARNAGTAP